MNSDKIKSIFSPTKFWRITILVAILVCGFGTRLYDLTDPPLDYAPSRQLRSAIIARAIYYRTADGFSDWERDVVLKQQSSQEMLEPEILENLIAFTYMLVGGEHVWIARIYSSLFWVLGGLALYALTREMVSDDGAVIALLYYLFVPFGLLASRTFQPDPLMTAVIICAWWSFQKWSRERSWRWAWIAGLAAGGAIMIKSTAVFFLFFGMAAVLLSEIKLRDLLKDLQIWLIAVIASIPLVLYNLYGFFVTEGLKGTLKGRLFSSQLWGKPDFYADWLGTTVKVMGHPVIVSIALLGLFFLQKKIYRRFLIGTWIGFVVYGFAVSYYVTTHSYYLLPIIPLGAITIGASADWVFNGLKKFRLTKLMWVGTLLAIIIGSAGGYYIYNSEDYRHEPDYYSRVASYVSPYDSVIALSQDYGFRLAYYGLINVQPWSRLDNLVADGNKTLDQTHYSNRFKEVMEKYDYFIVTRMKDFRQQTNLQSELTEHYPVLVEGGGFMIFDLRERLD